MIPIFVGYDPREAAAFHACASSIISNTTKPVSITPLALNMLPEYNETHTDGSNDFSYSRFLVPHLTNYYGWAIFIDGDMIVKGDLSELWDMRKYNNAVHVVKHDYLTKATTKYLGSKNENYPRKNWSSVVLWNCAAPENRILTPGFIEKMSGQYLHRFTWIANHKIGDLPKEWNWLCDEYGENPDAKLIHYTLGVPGFPEYKDTPMADNWFAEFDRMTHCKK